MRKAIATVVVVLTVGVLMAVSRPPSPVDYFGHVYESDAQTPVVGAVVSNDWDSTTVTTNAGGEFRLRVRRIALDESIKFTARIGDKSGWHRRVGSVTPGPVEIILRDPIDASRP